MGIVTREMRCILTVEEIPNSRPSSHRVVAHIFIKDKAKRDALAFAIDSAKETRITVEKE